MVRASTSSTGARTAPAEPVRRSAGRVGAALTPPTAEGGALRSQDLRTSSRPDHARRRDPARRTRTRAQALPNNPLAGSADANARRIIAHGFRNPFRFTIRPGTNEVWVGDVGWNDWEEINRIADPDATVENFGWPCYEGADRQSGYDSANLTICENLYAPARARVVAPYYAYNHSAQVVPGETCSDRQLLDRRALPSTPGGPLPPVRRRALLRRLLARLHLGHVPRWKRAPGHRQPGDLPGTGGESGRPRGRRRTARSSTPTSTAARSGGSPTTANQPPIASASASPTNGPAPLTVNFDGSGSSDPENGPLTYSWDLNGDGTYGDSTAAKPSYTYSQPGTFNARLRVTDNAGQASTSSPVTIAAGNSPPTATIQTPAAGTTWKVGDALSFTGSAADPQRGPFRPQASRGSSCSSTVLRTATRTRSKRGRASPAARSPRPITSTRPTSSCA